MTLLDFALRRVKMDIFDEYKKLVELYEKDPTHPHTQNELINICYLPEFYSNFGLNTDKQKLALSSKHLYTMQVAKENGYYSESHTTHYHNLKKDTMLKIPELIENPDFVLYDQSSFDLQENKIPSSLVCILPQKNIVINKKNKESRKEVLVAYIDEPINPNDNVTILATSFRRPEIEKYIERLIKKNRLLYINEEFLNGKKSLSTVYPGIQFTNIATHSNGETRNSMAFLGSLNDNISQYRENVNIERMKVSGLFLENIPDNEKTKKVCNTAFANNPASIIYFPDNITKVNKYERDVFETLNTVAIQSMPEQKFINNLQYFLQHTDKANHQGKILYRTINKRLSESQKTLLCESINKEHEPDEKEIIAKFVDWSEGNLHEKSLPQNWQTREYQPSEEKKSSALIEVIGKHFETDKGGKFTLESFKDIAKTMSIYSDKHYETARYLFVKDGQIMRHIAVSSQTPSSTIIKPDDDFLYQIKSYAESTDSKIVFIHNHPSGYVEPSEADINLTSYMQNFFQDDKGNNLFEGHIILDHGSYGLYTAQSREWNALINDKLEPLSKISENYKITLSEIGMRANTERNNSISAQSLKQLSDYAKKCDCGNIWNTKDWIPAFMMTGNGVVTSLEYINTIEFNNQTTLSAKLKSLGRACGSENIIFFPQHYEQFIICEWFAQLTGKVRDIYFENPDGTYETSQFRNGNIFNDLTKDEIKVQDTNESPELVAERINTEQKIYTESVTKNINSKENEPMKNLKKEDIIDNGIESIMTNGGASDESLEREYVAAESEVENIDEVQRQMDIDNGLIDENGNKIVYDGPTPETVTKEAATNFLLEKLEKSGITVISDKQQYENMLAYVREVNISLEMLNEEPHMVQEMIIDKKNESPLGTLDNQSPHAVTHTNKYILDGEKKQEVLTELSELLNECQKKDFSPNEFLSKLLENCGFTGENNSNYLKQNIEGNSYSCRISDHNANAINARHSGKTTSIVIKLSNNGKFKNYKKSSLIEFEYTPEKLTKEKMQGIVIGLQDWVKTGEYTDTNYDRKYETSKDELQAQLAEQMTLGGIKKTLMTGVAMAAMIAAVPKLSAETKVIGHNVDSSKFLVETVLDVTNLSNGYRAISNHGNKTDLNDITFIVDKDGKLTNVMSYEAFETNVFLEKGKTITTKPIQFKMSHEDLTNMMRDWNYKGLNLASHGGHGGIIDEYNENTYLNLMNGMMVGQFNENLAEFFIKDSLTYGFALNGKIYLDPDLADSNVAAHEYTHIWDKYTEKNNPILWKWGKEVFKKTSLWNEVINDENYSNIKNNENLVLSECHARIVGKMAEEVLERIALENGGEIKEEVIDWDKEVSAFIEKEFRMSDPELSMSEEPDYIQKKVELEQMKSFLMEPMKDLITGKNVSLEKKQERKRLQTESNMVIQQMTKNKGMGVHVKSQSVSGQMANTTKFPHEDLEHYTFQSGDTVKNYSKDQIKLIILNNSSERFKNLGYATDEEISVLKEIENNQDFSDEQKAVELDNAERFIAAKHLKENATEIIKESKATGIFNTPIFDINVTNKKLISNWEWNVPKQLIPEGVEINNIITEKSIPVETLKPDNYKTEIEQTTSENVNNKVSQVSTDYEPQYQQNEVTKESAKENDYDTIKQMQEQYQKQTVKLQKMLEESEREKLELQKKLDMVTQQMTENKGMAAHENRAVSDQNGVSAPVMQEQKTQEEIARKFNRDSAYIVGTKVPRFGVPELDENGKDTGRHNIIKGAVFNKLIINEDDPSKNTVIISITQENGSTQKIKMPEQQYNEIIVAEQNFRKALDGVSQDSWDWMKAHVDHDARLMLDDNNYRLNTPEDFIHNFRIHCRKQANNPQEAMKIAAWMVGRMAPADRMRFNKNRAQYEKSHGKGAYERDFLLKEFEKISAEKEFNPNKMNFDKDKKGTILETASINLIELKEGEFIEGTAHTKIGDIIPMAITTRDLVNKKLQTEKSDFKIVKVSKGLYPEDKIILFDEKSKASYTMPLKDVVKHIKKIERVQSQEEAKKIKKDNKKFEYDGPGR